jgi:ubiquinone/menaquinone biosynthesis C-methylase UbiE
MRLKVGLRRYRLRVLQDDQAARFARAVAVAMLACTAIMLPGCKSKPESVKPGINDSYKNVTDVSKWTNRFEVESREIYRERMTIIDQLDLEPGMDVADVGAGTGLFVEPIARTIEPGGTLYAVDLTPAFIQHIDERVEDTGLVNVDTVLCKEDSVELPRNSIDFAFICDTYHHFEYPDRTMRSLHKALRPGGEIIIIDFERIEGVSREWILGHVRASKETVIEELRDFGFELTEHQPKDDFLDENYIIRVRKVDAR